MKSISSTAVMAMLTLGSTITSAIAQQPTKGTADDLELRTPVYVGCYSDPGDLIDMGDYTFQAMGWCQPLCVRIGKPILAFVNGTNCLCGDSPPDSKAKIDKSKCDEIACVGYPDKKCGGTNAFQVWSDMYRQGDPTGTVKINIPSPTRTVSKATSTDSDGNVHRSTVFITQSGRPMPSVVSVTQTAAPAADAGPNRAVVAAGVVVGIVAFAAIIGGIIFFMRRKKQKALDEERRRHEAMTKLGGEKPPSTYSSSDSRLEPSVMFQRRQSDGSIMDNQDYSRRILKVTNPDDR